MPPKYDGLGMFAKIGIGAFFVVIAICAWFLIDWLFIPDTETLELENPIENVKPTRVEVLPLQGDTLYIYEETTPSVVQRLFKKDE